MKTLYVNWYGPYILEDIRSDSQCTDNIPYDLSQLGLYFIVGKRYRARNLTYYIGKTTNPYNIRFDKYHIVNDLEREQSIYLGKIIQPKQNMEYNIDLAEWMYIYFSQDNGVVETECDKKTFNPPSEDCAIITRFFKKDGSEYQKLPQFVRILPEFMLWKIAFNKLYYCTKLKEVEQ